MDTPREQWRIEMLGGLRMRRGTHVVERFQTQKTGALLARLAYPPLKPHPREYLVDLLWPDADIDSGRNRLSQALVWLRPQMEPPGIPKGSILRSDRQTVGLNPSHITSDVADFEAAIRSAASETQALQRATEVYTGDLLPGFYEDWVLTERQRLADAWIAALRRRSASYEALGDLAHALELSRRALSADVLIEDAHIDVMRLLALTGQTPAALRQFAELERRFAQDLAVEPSHVARALAVQIRNGGLAPFHRPRSDGSPSPSLPVLLTRFFGREAEIASLTEMVQNEQVHLITLLGPGGSGKTRPALEAATRLAPAYSGAVAFVPLADLSDPQNIPAAIADALRLTHSPGTSPWEQVLEALARRPFLLVLDNLEHIIEGITPWLHDLLTRVPTLILLVTSRQRLGLGGERELTVPPLPIPTGAGTTQEAVSVQMFTDRARAVRPDFAVSEANVQTVTRLCERLEGLPLAIELCAAWAQMLTPAQMLERLEHRFDLLVSRRTDIAPRHRTLRAALEYGFVQLSADLQRLFVCLSVFRGGWTLAAAEAVSFDEGSETPAILEALTELRERSLLVAEEAGAEMRYRMLEALREFAAEQQTWALEISLRERHAIYFLQMAEDADTRLRPQDQGLWLHRLDGELDNLRAALSWWAERDEWKKGLRLAIALSHFWKRRGYLLEGEQWLQRLINLMPDLSLDVPSDLRLRAQALNIHADILANLADFTQAQPRAQEALTAWRTLADASGTASALETLGIIAMMQEEYKTAIQILNEARSLADSAGDAAMVAGAVSNLGRIALARGDWQEAWETLSESLRLHQALGNRSRVASSLNNLALVARYRGDLTAAHDLLNQSLLEQQELLNRPGIAIALLNLGTVKRLTERFADARASLSEATRLAVSVGDRRVLAWCIKELGHLACAEGNMASGVRLLAAAESMRLALNFSFKPAGPTELARDIGLARVALGDAAVDAAWTGGLLLSREAAVAEALSALKIR
jgi:predicted ATPase/DNA-binding SARP family transcriptional activator